MIRTHRRLIVRANVTAVPLYRNLVYRTLREDGRAVASGIVLPVHFMEKS